MAWNNWKRKPDPCLTPYTKANLRCGKSVNIKKKMKSVRNY